MFTVLVGRTCPGLHENILTPIRDGPLFIYQGGHHFWDLQTIFFEA